MCFDGTSVNIKDTDELREVCSGMYGGEKAYISREHRIEARSVSAHSLNLSSSVLIVTFDPSSSGQLALVLYEWDDVKYLGADTPGNEDDSMPVRIRFCHLTFSVLRLIQYRFSYSSRKPTSAQPRPFDRVCAQKIPWDLSSPPFLMASSSTKPVSILPASNSVQRRRTMSRENNR